MKKINKYSLMVVATVLGFSNMSYASMIAKCPLYIETVNSILTQDESEKKIMVQMNLDSHEEGLMISSYSKFKINKQDVEIALVPVKRETTDQQKAPNASNDSEQLFQLIGEINAKAMKQTDKSQFSRVLKLKKISTNYSQLLFDDQKVSIQLVPEIFNLFSKLAITTSSNKEVYLIEDYVKPKTKATFKKDLKEDLQLILSLQKNGQLQNVLNDNQVVAIEFDEEGCVIEQIEEIEINENERI